MQIDAAAQSTKEFMLAIVNEAIRDEQHNISPYAPSRRGRELVKRLQRGSPRHGDQFEARRVYMAARFIYRTETESVSTDKE